MSYKVGTVIIFYFLKFMELEYFYFLFFVILSAKKLFKMIFMFQYIEVQFQKEKVS